MSQHVKQSTKRGRYSRHNYGDASIDSTDGCAVFPRIPYGPTPATYIGESTRDCNVRPPTPRILNNFLDPAVRTDFLLDGWDEVIREIPDFHALPELVSDESDDEIYTNTSMAA